MSLCAFNNNGGGEKTPAPFSLQFSPECAILINRLYLFVGTGYILYSFKGVWPLENLLAREELSRQKLYMSDVAEMMKVRARGPVPMASCLCA